MPTKSTTPNGRNYGITDAQAVPTAAAGPAATQQLVRDPVCGMEISPQEAAASTEVDQKRYWFCSPHCEQALLANPAKYILHPVDRRSSAGPSSSPSPPDVAPIPAARPALASRAAKPLAKDPICGMMVDKATALSAERGNRVARFTLNRRRRERFFSKTRRDTYIGIIGTTAAARRYRLPF